MPPTATPEPKDSEFITSNLVVQHGIANTGSMTPIAEQALEGIIKTREERIKHLKGAVPSVTPGEALDLRKAIVRCQAQIAEATAELKRIRKTT